jgi:putative two-component system response regulator
MLDKSLILVADDNESNLHMLSQMLKLFGYDVLLARNGREACELAWETPPDVILLDVMMPEMDGLEAARRLKDNESTKIIPIVMITALSETEDKIKALNAGADDFLTKPIEQAELRARISSLIKVKAYNDYLRGYQKKLEYEIAQKTESLKQTLRRVKMASLESIQILSCAAEYRDNETGLHIKRMSLYAAAVARRMGMAELEVEKLLYAAPMHDIGKIGIPDQILLKPGKLTGDEWVIMKQHTSIGAKILEGSDTDYIRLAHEIALTHHEKWDGTGYPNGLKGDQIPLAGRILAVVDVFDALTSKRPYKEPLSVEESLAIILKDSGKHFDPQVVDAFMAVKDDIVAIRQQNEDEGKSSLFRLIEGQKKSET